MRDKGYDAEGTICNKNRFYAALVRDLPKLMKSENRPKPILGTRGRWAVFARKNSQVAICGMFPSKDHAEDLCRNLRGQYRDDRAEFWIDTSGQEFGRVLRMVPWPELKATLTVEGSGPAVFLGHEPSRREADARAYLMVYRAMKERLGNRRRKEPIGCLPYTVDELIAHIEGQFREGMTWENWGEWQLDHIEPRSAFDMRDPKQMLACWALSNLQPLWGEENRAKIASDKQKAA